MIFSICAVRWKQPQTPLLRPFCTRLAPLFGFRLARVFWKRNITLSVSFWLVRITMSEEKSSWWAGWVSSPLPYKERIYSPPRLPIRYPPKYNALFCICLTSTWTTYRYRPYSRWAYIAQTLPDVSWKQVRCRHRSLEAQYATRGLSL